MFVNGYKLTQFVLRQIHLSLRKFGDCRMTLSSAYERISVCVRYSAPNVSCFAYAQNIPTATMTVVRPITVSGFANSQRNTDLTSSLVASRAFYPQSALDIIADTFNEQSWTSRHPHVCTFAVCLYVTNSFGSQLHDLRTSLWRGL